jgi:ATP-dependent Clp protease, protease subunit
MQGAEPPRFPAEPGGSLEDDVGRALLARRVVLVHGTIGEDAAARAAASLMMLDAAGDERIVLRLTGADSTIDIGLVLMDTIDALGVPVDTVGAGTLAGGAVGVFAAGRHRNLAQHARLHLREPDGSVAGRAVDIERAVAAQHAQRERFLSLLARATRRPMAHLVEEWSTDRFLEPADAVTLGYADAVETVPPKTVRGDEGAQSV